MFDELERISKFLSHNRPYQLEGFNLPQGQA
jgi:hypothetical protein